MELTLLQVSSTARKALDGKLVRGRTVQAKSKKKGPQALNKNRKFADTYEVAFTNLPGDMEKQELESLLGPGVSDIFLEAPSHSDPPIEAVQALFKPDWHIKGFYAHPSLDESSTSILVKFADCEAASDACLQLTGVTHPIIGNATLRMRKHFADVYRMSEDAYHAIEADVQAWQASLTGGVSFFVLTTASFRDLCLYAVKRDKFLEATIDLARLVSGVTWEWNDVFATSGILSKLKSQPGFPHVHFELDTASQRLLVFGSSDARSLARGRLDKALTLLERAKASRATFSLSAVQRAWLLRHPNLERLLDDNKIPKSFASLNIAESLLVLLDPKEKDTNIQCTLDVEPANSGLPHTNNAWTHCSVCYNVLSPRHRFQLPCRHSYCASCLHEILSAWDAPRPLVCIHDGVDCNQPFPPNTLLELADLGLESDLSKLYLRYVRTHPLLRICPTSRCSFVYSWDAATESGTDKVLDCVGCSEQICVHCQTRAHPGRSCQELVTH